MAFAILASTHAGAQQAGKVSRVGILGQTASDPSEARLWQAFRLTLRERGWREGENLRIESRWWEDDTARLPELAAELVRLKVDLIVTRGSTPVQAGVPGALAGKCTVRLLDGLSAARCLMPSPPRGDGCTRWARLRVPAGCAG
jgi:hypothetical protein